MQIQGLAKALQGIQKGRMDAGREGGEAEMNNNGIRIFMNQDAVSTKSESKIAELSEALSAANEKISALEADNKQLADYVAAQDLAIKGHKAVTSTDSLKLLLDGFKRDYPSLSQKTIHAVNAFVLYAQQQEKR